MPNTKADHDLVTAAVNITKPKRKSERRAFRHLGLTVNICSVMPY